MQKNAACWRVAHGWAEPDGDRARAWTASEHGVAGIEAQLRALRWRLPFGASASESACAALPFAAQQPVCASPVGASRSALAAGVESGANLRASGVDAGTGDWPRDHLPARLAGSQG